jgi:hypothetical protein
MAKLKRIRCSLGWTDHSFRRLQKHIALGTSMKMNKRRIHIRFIGAFNELVFHKPKNKMPF